MNLSHLTTRSVAGGKPIGSRELGAALRLVVLYAISGAVALVCLIPVAWLVKTSFESREFVRDAQIQFWPIQPTLENYLDVITNPHAIMGRSMLNSLIVALLSTLLNVALTASAGYAMSRFEFKGKLVFGAYLLLLYMIPRTLMFIGIFIMLARLHLINNLMGLVITYAAGGIPLSTWWLKGYFDAVPVEIEEQGMIDGCGRLGALWRLVVPLALPGVAAVAIFQFIESWNEFMMALAIIQSPELRTLPTQIVYFMGFQRTDWGPTMAFSVIVAIPAIIMFAFTQRNLVSGLMSGFSK
jgi:ABC-type glycerol-3-phosphate transport system permease component